MNGTFNIVDFEKIDLSPRGENILAPNANHHPRPSDPERPK